MAISSPCDFVCLKRNGDKLDIMMVECKKTVNDIYKFKPRERTQFNRLKEICSELGVKGKYYIKTKNKLHIIDVFDMKEVVV